MGQDVAATERGQWDGGERKGGRGRCALDSHVSALIGSDASFRGIGSGDSEVVGGQVAGVWLFVGPAGRGAELCFGSAESRGAGGGGGRLVKIVAFAIAAGQREHQHQDRGHPGHDDAAVQPRPTIRRSFRLTPHRYRVQSCSLRSCIAAADLPVRRVAIRAGKELRSGHRAGSHSARCCRRQSSSTSFTARQVVKERPKRAFDIAGVGSTHSVPGEPERVADTGEP